MFSVSFQKEKTILCSVSRNLSIIIMNIPLIRMYMLLEIFAESDQLLTDKSVVEFQVVWTCSAESAY